MVVILLMGMVWIKMICELLEIGGIMLKIEVYGVGLVGGLGSIVKREFGLVEEIRVIGVE